MLPPPNLDLIPPPWHDLLRNFVPTFSPESRIWLWITPQRFVEKSHPINLLRIVHRRNGRRLLSERGLAMTPDVEAFLREIETLSEFRAAVARNPKVAADFEAMERGLHAVYRVGADDARMIELFDALRRVVARDELTIKRRLAAIQAILARALVEQQQGGLKG